MAINISDIIAQLQQATSRANAANEARYAQGLEALNTGLGTMRSYYDQASNLYANSGAGLRTDAGINKTRAQAQGTQDLITAGLGNTTITQSLKRGVDEDYQRALERIADQQAQQQAGVAIGRAGAEGNYAGNIANFIAARNDIQPDMGLYSSLIAQAAAGQAAQQPTTIQAGLGANARAGLDAFGQPLGSWVGGGSSSASGGFGGIGNISSSMGGGSSSGSGASSSGGGGNNPWEYEANYQTVSRDPSAVSAAVQPGVQIGAPGQGEGGIMNTTTGEIQATSEAVKKNLQEQRKGYSPWMAALMGGAAG